MYTHKKSLGQHFLKDELIIQKIVEALKANDFSRLLEVGPGAGALTKELIKFSGIDFKAIELDREKVDYLHKKYEVLKDKVIEANFLDIEMPFQENFTVIGNFPYNISSQILFKALENKDYVPEVVGMFQKEVAERIASGPGNKEYGILSVLMQAFYDIRYLFTVKPGSFNPPPKVNSGVIALQRKKNYKELGCDENLLKIIVKASFNQRRKMLRNSLKPFFPKDVIENDLFYEKRPEQLSLQEFVFLTNQVEKFRQT